MRIPSGAICVLIALLGWSLMASGQTLEVFEQATPEEVASDQSDFWARTLGLNKEQTAALEQINLRYAMQMSTAVKSAGDDAQKQASLEALEQERSEEMADLLTPEQRQRYTDLTEQVERFVKDHTR